MDSRYIGKGNLPKDDCLVQDNDLGMLQKMQCTVTNVWSAITAGFLALYERRWIYAMDMCKTCP